MRRRGAKRETEREMKSLKFVPVWVTKNWSNEITTGFGQIVVLKMDYSKTEKGIFLNPDGVLEVVDKKHLHFTENDAKQKAAQEVKSALAFYEEQAEKYAHSVIEYKKLLKP